MWWRPSARELDSSGRPAGASSSTVSTEKKAALLSAETRAALANMPENAQREVATLATMWEAKEAEAEAMAAAGSETEEEQPAVVAEETEVGK